jgi:flavin-binding protein dodecin
MNARLIARVALTVIFHGWVASSAGAQGVGAIAGSVLDDAVLPLPGVTVTLSSAGVIGGDQEILTDARGTYQFVRLVPGTYTVTARLVGFSTRVQEGIVVNADATARADLQLAIGALQETITVTGEAPVIDTQSTLRQQVMSREAIDALPARTDLWTIGKHVPGLVFNKHDVGGSESFAQSYATVHGSLTSENGYMVDGMEVALPRGTGGFVAGYWDAFMFDEVNYQVANAPAERSRGGILYNMITRTGSNNFTGQAQLIGTGNRLQSNNISPALRTQLLKQVRPQVLAANPDIEPSAEILDLYDFSARASGPIIEDKLWYATAVKRMILNQIRLGSYDPDGSPVLDDSLMRNFSTKLSWQVARDSQLHYLFNFNQKTAFHYAGNTRTSFRESAATWLQNNQNKLHQVKWTDAISSRMVMDASVSHYRSVLGCCNKQPEVQVGDIPIFDTVQRIQRVSMPTYQSGPQQRNNFLTSLSYLTGAHDLKIGYQYMLIWNRRLDVSYSHFPAGLEILTRNDVPSAVRTYNTPTTNNNRAADHAVYFQDRWSPHRKWTLNLGVRIESTYGRQLHEDGFVCQATTIFIQGQCFAASEGVPDFLDVTPRLSAIYDVTGDGRTALKFTANRYMIPIGSDYLSLVNPLRVTRDTRAWTDANGDFMPQLEELGPSTGFNLGTTNRFADDLVRPHTMEYSVALERELFRGFVANVAYYNRSVHRNLGSRNLAVPTDSYIPMQVTEALSGEQVTVFNQDPALRGQFDRVYGNYPEMDQTYNGVEVTFNKRLDRWSILGGLTVGRATGDIYGRSADLNDPNYQFRRGVTGFDVPVSFKVAGLYQLPYGVSAAYSFQHLSGFPELTTVLVGGDTVALTQVRQRITTEPHATSRLPKVNILDISLRKGFRSGDYEVEPALEFFNALNASPILRRIAQLGPSFGNASDILRGRMIRLAVNVRF